MRSSLAARRPISFARARKELPFGERSFERKEVREDTDDHEKLIRWITKSNPIGSDKTSVSMSLCLCR